MEPAVVACNDALGAKHHAVFFLIFKLAESIFNVLAAILLGCFNSPGGEHLVCVVVMMAVTAASAGAFLVMMVVLMVVLVASAVAIFIVVMVVLMMVLVATAVAFLIVVVMLVATTVAFLIVVVMLMVVLVATTVTILIMVMVMFVMMVVMMVRLFFHFVKLCRKSISALDYSKDICTAYLIPLGCNKACLFVMRADHFNCLCDLVI